MLTMLNPYQVKSIDDKIDTLSQKKILFVIDTLQLGGAEQSLLANTSRFQRTKSVVCHLYRGETLKSKFIENGIKVYSFNIEESYGFIEAYKQLKKVVEVEKPDLMVAYLTRSEIVTRLMGRFMNIPVIGTFLTDLYSKTYNQHLSWKAKQKVLLFKLINKLTSKICIGFVANSQAIKESNARQLSIPLHKIKVINRGRDSSIVRCKNFEQPKSNSTLRFLNVGRLFPVKGQKELILGFKKFTECHSSATLHIIGDGPMRETLQQTIIDNKLEDKVFLLGARNDVSAIIADFDCFIFSSFVEGFSGSLVEAMFAGVPILATNIPQNREVITHLQTGYLFNKGSIEEIEKALLWYKDNLSIANILAKKAYEYAREKFELEKVVMKFENYLHNKIINQN